LACELASMEWRTCGGWRAPVIVMVACGGYRPGLGPFHSHSFESVMAHVPGIDVALPSSAGDAAGMLNDAFHSERPTLLFYPKALLHDRRCATSPDVATQGAPRGQARLLRSGEALTLVAWGNTVSLCERAADLLAGAGFASDVIDLRWLSPWDHGAVIASARKTGRLVVVHEDNIGAGFGAEVLAAVNESMPREVVCRRVARADAFIPSRFDQQLALLPSYRRVVEAACELLELDVAWEVPTLSQCGEHVVRVFGASPTDHSVEIVELNVEPGEHVDVGQIIACVEADKAAAELASPTAGIVLAVHVKPGDKVAVGLPLLTLRTNDAASPCTGPPADVARIKSRLQARCPAPKNAPATAPPGTTGVHLVGLGVARGRLSMDNEELARHFSEVHGFDSTSLGLLERTGIQSQLVADATQDVVSMGVDASSQALHEAGILATDLALVICSTSTARQIVPSTACEVVAALAPGAVIPAYDLSAACSGYLYALANAWDFLQQRPDAHVLVITSETMRRVIQLDDPAASPVFGDAASATILTGQCDGRPRLARLHRPVLGALGDHGITMRLPLPGTGSPMLMNPGKVFSESVRRMSAMLDQACAQSGLRVADLAMVVPHQANGRVIEALRLRLRLHEACVWNEVRHRGNTSSSAIPMALDTLLRSRIDGGFVGLCAFGAGLTFGGAVLEICQDSPSR
jgi:2-oxoisovalerate dehydrogenase E1 component